MTRKLWNILLLLLVIVAAAVIGEQIQQDDSYVLIKFKNQVIETTIWIFLLLLSVLVVAIYALIRMLVNWRVDHRFANWRVSSRSNAAKKRTSAGLAQLARGRFKEAQKSFIKAAPYARIPALNYLLGALAAQAEGKDLECDEALTIAESAEGTDPVLVGLLQALVHMQRGNNEQALASLKRLEPDDKNPLFLEMLARVYQRLEDWDSLDNTIGKLEKLGRPGKLGSMRHQVELTLHRLQVSKSAQDVKSIWKNLNKTVKTDQAVQLGYCKNLVRLGETKLAEQELQKAINLNYTKAYITAYGEMNVQPSQQLVVAEQWLKQRPNDADLLLALGRISLRNKLWGKAKEYFELSASLSPNSLVHAELARFYAALKDSDKSQHHFEQSVRNMHELPELPLPQGQIENSSV